MARTKVHAINPNFARKSRTDWFTKRDHLPTQGFRALLILLASCKEVSAFGFSGGAGWYFDKVKNRGPADKRKHGQGLAKNRWLDAPKPAADRVVIARRNGDFFRCLVIASAREKKK